MKKLALLLGIFAIMVFFGSANATIWTCGTCASCQSIAHFNINHGDTLLLNASFNTTISSSCFSSFIGATSGMTNISTWVPYDNITIDCQGYTVDGLGGADIGIALGSYVIDSSARNITVKNCNLNNFVVAGIQTRNIDDLKIINVTSHNSGVGIDVSCGLYSPDRILIEGNSMLNNGHGISISQYGGGACDMSNVTIKDNILQNVDRGVFINSIPCSADKLIYNNFFNNSRNVLLAYVSPPGNCTWNTTITTATNIIGGNQIGGNFWALPNGTGFSQTCDNLNNDSFCDSIFNPIGIAINQSNIDFLPLSLNYSEENVSELNIEWETPANNSIISANSIGWSVNLSEPPISCLLSINGSANVTMTINSNICSYISTGLSNLTTYCGQVFANDLDESNVSSTQCATTIFGTVQQPLIGNLGLFSTVAGLIMGAGLLLFLLDGLFGSVGLLKDPKNLITLFIGALIIASVITIFFV